MPEKMPSEKRMDRDPNAAGEIEQRFSDKQQEADSVREPAPAAPASIPMNHVPDPAQK